MSETMTIEFDEHATEELRELATALHRTPESLAQEAILSGIQMVRRYATLKRGAESVDVEKVISMLRTKRNDNAPDPGDELPEDLKYLLDERRA